MRKVILMLAVLAMLSGCSQKQGLDFEQLAECFNAVNECSEVFTQWDDAQATMQQYRRN